MATPDIGNRITDWINGVTTSVAEWAWSLVGVVWDSLTTLPNPEPGATATPGEIGDFLALWGVALSAGVLILSLALALAEEATRKAPETWRAFREHRPAQHDEPVSEEELRQQRIDTILEAGELSALKTLASEKARIGDEAASDAE